MQLVANRDAIYIAIWRSGRHLLSRVMEDLLLQLENARTLLIAWRAGCARPIDYLSETGLSR